MNEYKGLRKDPGDSDLRHLREIVLKGIVLKEIV